MPNFPIVDTHVHLSDIGRIRYSNLKEEAPSLHRDFTLENYRAALGPVEIGEMVFMEVACDRDDIVREVDWVAELAAGEPKLTGIVANAPLEENDLARATLEQYTQYPLVKGIRRLLQTESLDFCLRDDFLAGLRLLPAHDLSFDICIYHPHLANVVTMVARCPEVRFILDHIGKPNIKEQVFEPWKAEIKALAALPNVVCKISGMTTEADHDNWTREDLKPYIDHVVECFGFDRVIHGGDWFVMALATTYPRWIETLDWALQGCSEEELRKFYVENAKSFYRL